MVEAILTFMQEYSQLALFFVAAGSLAAAVFSWRSSRTAANAMRMNLILDFVKRDASPDFGKATKALYEFRNAGSGNITERFASLKVSDKAAWDKIDNDRRIVHKFWLQLMQVRFAGLITDDEIVAIFLKSQIETVVNILEPFEQAKEGKDYTKVFFDHYKLLLANYDELYKKKFGVPPGYKSSS